MKMIAFIRVIRYIESHARPETMALVNELKNIDNKIIKYKGAILII